MKRKECKNISWVKSHNEKHRPQRPQHPQQKWFKDCFEEQPVKAIFELELENEEI